MRKLDTGAGRPLYRQLREIFIGRISDGTWKPGDALPSEQKLAGELGVSQGTVRKALDDLEASRLIVRHQGLGTFVAVQSSDSTLFQFFRVINAKRQRVIPDCRELSRAEGAPTRDEAQFLELKPGARVYRIRRLRPLEGRNDLLEIVTAPAAVFPGLIDGDDALPNTLYDHYQSRYGITIQRASEDVKAAAAPKQVVKWLDLEPGSPVLQILRTAYALDGSPVERRVSWLDTSGFSYHNEIV